jgi:hypothetical protein
MTGANHYCPPADPDNRADLDPADFSLFEIWTIDEERRIPAGWMSARISFDGHSCRSIGRTRSAVLPGGAGKLQPKQTRKAATRRLFRLEASVPGR